MTDFNKTFIAGRMNKDLDERLVPDGEYIDALNITIDTAGGSNIGSVSNSLGNVIVSNIQSLVEDQGVTYDDSAKTIGVVAFEANNLIYWLVTSDNFDAIFEYSEIYQLTSIVLLCTNGQLGFNKNYPVTGINYIPETNGSGPFLYWTDGLNPPRRINIARAKSYITNDPRINEDINVILRPPLYSPKIDLEFDPSIDVSNNIQDKFIYFSYRFKYKDNQYSSLSPFSSVAFHANSFSYDYNTGDNKGMLNKYNKVNITFDTGNQFVEEIQVLYFDTYALNVYIVDNYNKKDLNINDDSRYEILTFSASKIYTPLESSEVTRLFDNVPLTAKAQDIVGNRLLYGQYVQFRDIVNSYNQKIIPNYELFLEYEFITTEPKKTFRSDRDYEIGIIYTDEYGRMTTALTSKKNTLYIPPKNSDTANSIVVLLNNEPPYWATNYRFAIKQAQGDYYNIFPRTFVVDDVFRYFLINESDRDKITVGGYIIFKTSNGLATHSNKQFKVLELEYKTATTPFTIEGLYFKVKADPIDYFLDAPTQQVLSLYNSGRGPRPNLCTGDPETKNPVVGRSPIVQFEKSYYSGTGDYTLIYPWQTGSADIDIVYDPLIVGTDLNKDFRITVKIVTDPSNPTNEGTHFEWTDVPDGDTGYSSPIPIPVPTSYYSIYPATNYQFNLIFNSGIYNVGDLYVFNARANFSQYASLLLTVIDPIGTLFPPSGIPCSPTEDMSGLDPDDYGGHAILPYNGPIYPGAIIEINILKDTPPTGSEPTRNQNNLFTNGNYYYKNFEEWFWKSGAYQSFQYQDFGGGVVTSANNITFRRGLNTNPIPQTTGGSYSTNYISEDSNVNTGILCMLIRGVGSNHVCSRNEIQAELKLTQTPTVQLSAETVPLKSDIDLFYEMRKTYRIENGNHMLSWPYADYTDANVVFPSEPLAAGGTVLGPLDPNNPGPLDMMHSFNIGEVIYVVNSSSSYGPPTGYYSIIYITQYAIVIDLAFPGIGPVTPGKVFYRDFEQDQNFSGTPLILELNNVTSDNSDFNAFAFGNGVESYRIYDNFLRPTMKYSPRATSVIEDYKQENKYASLCYSGIYKGDTSTNRLNSFNLSQANFKNLDKKFGPIQKLYAMDTNLIVLQQDKITSVLYGKNLLYDAVGGSQVASIPEVLGTQIAHPSEYGISNNPESFAIFSNMMFFADARRGAVLQMTGDQVVEISGNGMKNYFRDTFKDTPNTQKIGMYDPYNNAYVLSLTDVVQGSCSLSMSPTVNTINKESGDYFMFSITSNVYWTLSLSDVGDGIDWITLSSTSGYGNQEIFANVLSNLGESYTRSVEVIATYCDGKQNKFTLFQLGNLEGYYLGKN